MVNSGGKIGWLKGIRSSVLVRLGLTMGFLAVISIVSIVMSMVIADSSSGKANAINVSGSLRMMSFRLLSEVQQPGQWGEVPTTIRQFKKRLDNLEKFVLESDPGSELHDRVRFIRTRWQNTITRLAHEATRSPSPQQARAAQELAREIPEFVASIDGVVLLIEIDLERRIYLLQAVQFALFAVSIVISVITIWLLKHQLVGPLAELLKAARIISQGSFTPRVQHTGNDELGQLGHAFNAMMDEISRMYGSLEAMVDEKTRALTRTNQSLELLYQTSQRLSGDLSLDVIQSVLRDIEAELELGHSMLCLSEQGVIPAQRLLSNLSEEEMAAFCSGQNCEHCFRYAERGTEALPVETASGMKVQYFPLEDNQQVKGILPLVVGDKALPREKMKIIETVGRHIANALSSMRRAEERHRLAVLEERSVIARELHDSIAQSLSYLKIQVSRLEKRLPQGVDGASSESEAALIAAELKHGLNAAYRELRELITTFRLRLDERGFNAALQETVEEFSRKCGFAIQLDNQLAEIVLSANEEMHVTRIIREALANIEKHAKASAAQITIALDAERRVLVRVRDDGCGFDPETPARNHYGLIIMRDRALILDGQVDILPCPAGGTEVRLVFKPQQFSAPISG